MDEEPAENISGGAAGGGAAARFDPADADSRAERVVDRLGDLYWQKTYGGRDAFECLVRTILSQNTSDVASQPAHDALMKRYGDGAARTTDGTDDGDSAPDEAAGDQAGVDRYGGDRADDEPPGADGYGSDGGDADLAAAWRGRMDAWREAVIHPVDQVVLRQYKDDKHIESLPDFQTLFNELPLHSAGPS